MYSRDTNKINTKHPLYNKPQTPRQKFAARLNWLKFQTKAATGNVVNAYHQVAQAEESVRGDINPVKRRELAEAWNNAVKSLRILEDRIVAFKE